MRAPRSPPVALLGWTIRESAAATSIDSCNCWRKRACGDALGTLLPVVRRGRVADRNSGARIWALSRRELGASGADRV
jgi:hypothetical protein